MPPVETPTSTASPQEPDRERAFFVTWIRLMEHINDATTLTETLYSMLIQSDSTAKLQYQTNLQSVNNKTMKELVATINEFFFKDIKVVLKRPKTMKTRNLSATTQQRQDSLDQYLEHGEDGAAMPQAFVDNMSGWGTSETEQTSRKKVPLSEELAVVDDQTSYGEISSIKFHDLLISNGLKLTAKQAPDYPDAVHGRANHRQTPPTATTGNGARTVSPRGTKTKAKTTANKRNRAVPPPIVTNLPPRSTVRSSSTPSTQSRSPEVKTDRISKQVAKNLMADQVLGVRTYGKVKEFLIRWRGVDPPLWIARRKASAQALELIDTYSADLRAGGEAAANLREEDPDRKGKKKISRTGTSHSSSNGSGADFYTVNHIVKHRMSGNKREYLVRWENYDESEDTWEAAEKLRVDVPEIVKIYEEKIQSEPARTEAVHSAFSELIRDESTSSSSKTKKGSAGEKSKIERKSHAVGRHSKEKRRRSSTGDKEDKVRKKSKKQSLAKENHAEKGHHKQKSWRFFSSATEAKENEDEAENSEDLQFGMEEAEVAEYSEGEFVDTLNS